ncbi:MAG: Ldh family oxidoreductase [Rhodospirillales bacterium]|jgi:L-2-hydroxycarboxylate dehydrogenase (NAD+)|nr:Ldh family oxidoreductase [Rhodospirillales bacterium]
MNTVVIAPEQLTRFAADLFTAVGVPTPDARGVAEYLVEADLRGVRSHGVARLPVYLRRLEQGIVKTPPEIKVREAAPAAVHVDGDNGLGFIVARRAMNEAIDRAEAFGVAVAAVFNSNHFGIAANYLQQALDAGLAAMVLTNAPPAMAVWGGKKPLLGTNPIGLAMPGGDSPLMLDMATSTVAKGKIRRAANQGETIPTGWALDEYGQPTTDAAAALRGVVLPLGGAKGSGLALMVDALSGVVSGAAFGGEVGNQNIDFEAPQNVGHFFMVFRPDLFLPAGDFAVRMNELVARIRGCPRADGFEAVLVPGEPEAMAAEIARRDGLVFARKDLDELNGWAGKFGIEMQKFTSVDRAPNSL